MSKFTDAWKTRGVQKAAGDVYTIRVNGGMYSQHPDKAEAQEMLDMLRAQGTYGVLVRETVVGETAKSFKLEKPAKFDRCVEHVKQSNPGADAYAVCNAVLADKSLTNKSAEYCMGLIDLALKNMGITGAGPIPRSLLARQDLEGTTSKAADDSQHDEEGPHETITKGFSSIYELTSRIKANQRTTAKSSGSFKDFWSQVRPTNKVNFRN